MVVAYPPARPVAQIDMPDINARLHRKVIARTVNDAMAGHTNTTVIVTLDAGVGTTTVVDARISAGTCAGFCPLSANAAADIPTLWVIPTNGTMTINHAVSAATDRTFNVSLTG